MVRHPSDALLALVKAFTRAGAAVRITILHIKVLHTAIFFVLSGCVLYVLLSGAFNRITNWTWAAVVAVIVEGFVLAASGGRCPLTAIAERLGATNGAVADIFLPRWFADRIFPICGTLFVVGVALVLFRLLGQ
jgi:hypothetical protein